MPIPLNNPTLVDALVLVLIGLYVMEDVRNGILYGLVQLAGLLLALLPALGCRQPQPTYEYGETETTITTTPPPGRAVVTTSTLAAAPKEPAWKRGEGR